MAVLLERHHLVDLKRPEFDNPTDVVASKVDEHHVLGNLFGVLDELGCQLSILLLGRSALSGAGDRPADHPTPEQLDHRLR